MPATTAERQRRWKDRRRQEGKKQVTVLLSEEACQKLAELKDKAKEKTLSAALERLILLVPPPETPPTSPSRATSRDNIILDQITLDDLKNPEFQNAFASRQAADYIARDLDDYGFSEIDNWQIDDLEIWQEILDELLYTRMTWQDEDPDAREEAAYNRALKSLGRAAAKELKKRLPF